MKTPNTQQAPTIDMVQHGKDREWHKAFGVYVGLFNKSQGTKLSVKAALKVPELVNLFELVCRAQGVINEKIKPQNTQSTRSKSYSLLDIPKIDNEIYQFIQKNPGWSRSEISNKTGIRLQTVCGAAKRLLDNSLIFVSGTQKDLETGREVELLTTTTSEK